MNSRTTMNESNRLHKIYTSDPLAFKCYVDKEVTITTQDSHVYTGIVYTVDPVSESFVLVVLPEESKDEMQMKIIMGSSIRNIDCSYETKVSIPEMFVTPRIHLTQGEINRRKNVVTKLLLENKFPVTEERGILCIEDTVKIEPPYLSENCICSNSIILNRIQTILCGQGDKM